MVNIKGSDGSGASGSAKNEIQRIHSQKYDDVLKAKKDEIRRKRGALDLNSDLENLDGDGSGAAKGFVKSKIHQNLIKQEKEAKENMKKDHLDRIQRSERAQLYARNVQEMYKPGSKSVRNPSSNSQRKKFINNELGQRNDNS